MLKRDFFLAAMHALEYKRRAWIISAFALINEAPEDYKRDPYPYRIVQTPTGHFFVSPENRELVPIEGAVAGEPIFSVKEKLLIGVSDNIPNFISSVKTTEPATETTYGRLLFNFAVLVYSFNNKIAYINKQADPTGIESIIVKRLVDDVKDKDGSIINPFSTAENIDLEAPIYVSEYLKFCNSMFFLTGLTQICVPAATRKVITAAPGIVELKERLLKENEGKLHDPAVIARIDAELVAYDRDYMKGDPGEGFLINAKSYDIVRKRLFSMHGAETGLDEGNDVALVSNSLSQGWDIEKFPAMINSLRAGSYNRGAQTMLGGESVKWLLRASSNINITEEDCGSTLGMVFDINEGNLNVLVGFHVITPTGTVFIDNIEAAKQYLNKTVSVRSPMFCKLDKTDYCKKCVGKNLSNQPTGASVAISDYGSAMLYISLKAMHGKKLALARMDYKKAIF